VAFLKLTVFTQVSGIPIRSNGCTELCTTPAGPTFEQSCTAYTKAFTDGSKVIADDSYKAIDEV
jgi:hypothetical protein